MSPENAARLEALEHASMNSWIALSSDESRIVAVGATYAEIEEKVQTLGDDEVVLMKTPERWGALAL